MSAEIKHSNENAAGITPHIYDEHSRLRKTLFATTPKAVTSFTDLAVNPIQSKVISKNQGAKIIEFQDGSDNHRKMLELLQQLGIEIIYSDVSPIKEGHAPLFARDVGIVIEDKVIPSRFRHHYRSIEVQPLIDVVTQKSIVSTDRNYTLEGGDIAILEPDLILVGIGPRTNNEGLSLLRETFPKKEFIPVFPIVEDKAFHLDTILGILGEKLLVYLPSLVSSELMSMLKERGYNFIKASLDEYDTCCTNVLAIDNYEVIAAKENSVTNQALLKAGVKVIETPLSGILSLGGGPHCLALPLSRYSSTIKPCI